MQQRLLLVTLLLLTLSLLAATPASAIDRVIINSGDWHDVYSGMLYASLIGVPSNFLVSQKHGAILLYSIPPTEDDLFVITSRTQPFVAGYKAFLQGRGYENPEELLTRNANLDLAERLENITSFIIIDPAYGYNAISAAPYAVVAKRYVLFADRRNIDEVLDFLQRRNHSSLLLFGQLDREVKEALAPFKPEILNKGDRFSNNLAMVEKYKEYANDRQVILTDGEFIEASLLSGADPVIFIGKMNVPEKVAEYIKKSHIQVGILIGNELIGTATFIRRQLGISVFVKFAQGARVPRGAIAQVEDLDRFPMPSYALNLEVSSVTYNRATGSLEVTYHNPVDLALYFSSTIRIVGGEEPVVTGDEEPVFLDKGAYKTIVYQYDTDGNPLIVEGENLTSEILTIYGEGPGALENALQARVKIAFVEVADESLVEITGLAYDKRAKHFLVTIENTGPVDAYVLPEIIDLLINEEPVTVSAGEPRLVKRGKSVKVAVPVELSEQDLLDNPEIKVRAYYGERELALIKVVERTFPLAFTTGYGMIVLYGGLILLALTLLFWLATKKRCKQCGHKNPRGRKRCEQCGNKL